MPADLEKARDECGAWEDDLGCCDDYPAECPYSETCRKDAEED